jgi:drug/metabolite transporter (DMT)-like permease
MTPGLWGLLAALGWGTADFLARFTGTALGYRSALLGMLGTSALVFTGIVWVADSPPELGSTLVSDPSGLWLLGVSGFGMTFGTMLLYLGLARGPIGVVAPIVGAYPALNVAWGLVRGLQPHAAQWMAIIAVIAGVAGVALLSPQNEDSTSYSRRHVRGSAFIALGAAGIFALTMSSFQEAMGLYGELQTVWLVRCISLVAIAAFMGLARETPRLPVRYFPLLVAQGGLDGAAYLVLLYGSHGDGATTVIVVSSAFAVVTVVLARLILREAVSIAQWAAIALVVGGVAILSA